MTQYGAALDWLRRTELVTGEGRLAAVSSKMELALLKAAIVRADPLWLRDADQLIITPDDLPEDAAAAGDALGLNPRETLAAVRAAWGKVDTTTRHELGLAGEQALVRLLQDLNCLTVTYVAEYADGLGYDVAVAGDGFHLNFEVKSTTRRGRLTVYLSRNEYEVMLTDPRWRLVVVLVGQDTRADAVGTIDAEWITHHAPIDVSSLGRWESVRFDIPHEVARNGIADLVEQVDEGHLIRTGAGETRPSWLRA
ncbi:protein NO VEIN domain-containing protein [Streptosporangium canum]|uniref:protein NO VEIN domain-containing protein n=1 Tax=Streptosporangium canum TaxID=324952 RepID=UPI0037A62AA7